MASKHGGTHCSGGAYRGRAVSHFSGCACRWCKGRLAGRVQIERRRDQQRTLEQQEARERQLSDALRAWEARGGQAKRLEPAVAMGDLDGDLIGVPLRAIDY